MANRHCSPHRRLGCTAGHGTIIFGPESEINPGLSPRRVTAKTARVVRSVALGANEGVAPVDLTGAMVAP